MLLSAPLLYFPNQFPAWAPWFACALLVAGVLWRRRMLGVWHVPTPADWPLFFLFFVMLPVALWAAPSPLRLDYALPRALIMVWNFALFWVVVVYSSRSAAMRTLFVAGLIAFGVLIAVAGLFGTQWGNKFPVLSPVLNRLPPVLVGRFAGAEDGFSPNQLAGSLLYVLPLALALGLGGLRRRQWLAVAALAVAVAIMGTVFLLTQSRAGFVGLAVSLAVLVLAPWKWGRYLLVASALLAVAAVLLLPIGDLLLQADDATRAALVEGGVNMAGRFEIWGQALYAIQDFPFTGPGLGMFRHIAPLLYPSSMIPPSFDIAHAHNFFLQTALDFGIPGLIALLALYMAAFVQCGRLYRDGSAFPLARYWAIGLLAALIGQAVYSLADAVAMGSKTNLAFWWLLALVFGITAQTQSAMRMQADQPSAASEHLAPAQQTPV